MSLPPNFAFSLGVHKITVCVIELSFKFLLVCFSITKFCFSFRSPLASSLPRVCNMVSPDVKGDGCVWSEKPRAGMVRLSLMTTSPIWIDKSTADRFPVAACRNVESPVFPNVARFSRSHSSMSAGSA